MQLLKDHEITNATAWAPDDNRSAKIKSAKVSGHYLRSRVPMLRFRYDASHDILKCPKERILRPKRPLKYGRFFYSRPSSF